MLPDTKPRLVASATGEEAAPGEAGEPWGRGPQAMAGNPGTPDVTAQTLAEGWPRTGDIARVD
ncbi:hypothetical protein [Streptomyces sp. bgisy027]|uniref:hypothetical protein n=1 Tax=unclassified Streptomyces TaxID=2593676 RepID=UPI003D756B5B